MTNQETFEETLNILAVGARLANEARTRRMRDGHGEVSVVDVESARRAFDVMRVVPFDLVVVGVDVADVSAETFVTRLVKHKPWQKWLFVFNVGAAESHCAEGNATRAGLPCEATLRSLGAVAILEGGDAWNDVVAIARRVRRNRPNQAVAGFALKGVC